MYMYEVGNVMVKHWGSPRQREPPSPSDFVYWNLLFVLLQYVEL